MENDRRAAFEGLFERYQAARADGEYELAERLRRELAELAPRVDRESSVSPVRRRRVRRRRVRRRRVLGMVAASIGFAVLITVMMAVFGSTWSTALAIGTPIGLVLGPVLVLLGGGPEPDLEVAHMAAWVITDSGSS